MSLYKDISNYCKKRGIVVMIIERPRNPDINTTSLANILPYKIPKINREHYDSKSARKILRKRTTLSPREYGMLKERSRRE